MEHHIVLIDDVNANIPVLFYSVIVINIRIYLTILNKKQKTKRKKQINNANKTTTTRAIIVGSITVFKKIKNKLISKSHS